MNIPNYRDLKQRTDSALKVARDPKKTILVYASVLTGLSLLVSILLEVLDARISNAGGLSKMDTRSILSTVRSILPVVQSLVLLCLEMGYLGAALRFARKQYADHRDLRSGLRYLAPLLRMVLLQALIYTGILLAVTNLVAQLYLITPFAQPLLEAVAQLPDPTAALDDQALAALFLPMLPMLVITMAVFALLAVPLAYRYRMANYRLLDHPQEGARAALRSSRHMMRGNCFRLFKVDLHFWWYYLLTFLATVICYGDSILLLVGVQLPISETAAYFLFYALYLVIQFFLFLGFRNRLEVTYTTAYEAIRPQEAESGVVLGNIFDMA